MNSNQTKIHYAHKRYIDPETGTVAAKGGMTAAWIQAVDNQILYATARCHKNDSFNKQQGRVKSAGRLNSEKHATLFSGTPDQFKQWFYGTPISTIGNL